MMKIINTQFYRIVVPKFIRKKIVARVLRASVLEYYSSQSMPYYEEIEKVLGYLGNRSVAMFPYYFQDNYNEDDIEVFFDHEKRLPYVLTGGKRLYLKKRWSKKRIRISINNLMKEQDPQSPHCYESDSFKFQDGDVLVDVGAAEGNFALSVVEKASRIILFESNREWIEPLNATFDPWKDKVTIVNKFVGDISNSKCTTLDDFFSDNRKLSFLKIDVEGAESRLLKGCKRILQEQFPLKVAICSYHKQEDEQEFKDTLSHYGFETSHSEGFVLLFTDRKIKPPYLRRGLIRAVKC